VQVQIFASGAGKEERRIQARRQGVESVENALAQRYGPKRT
jgi:hypothetical protein